MIEDSNLGSANSLRSVNIEVGLEEDIAKCEKYKL